MRRARWRLRQRSASRLVLPSARLRIEVVLGLGVAAGAGDRDAVDGGVDLAVAAAVEAVAVGVARADGDGCDAAGARELGVAGKALGAGDLADQLARGQRVAQIQLARKLTEAIWHMLTRNQPFAPAGATFV
jgi:hypothetical protein